MNEDGTPKHIGAVSKILEGAVLAGNMEAFLKFFRECKSKIHLYPDLLGRDFCRAAITGGTRWKELESIRNICLNTFGDAADVHYINMINRQIVAGLTFAKMYCACKK